MIEVWRAPGSWPRTDSLRCSLRKRSQALPLTKWFPILLGAVALGITGIPAARAVHIESIGTQDSTFRYSPGGFVEVTFSHAREVGTDRIDAFGNREGEGDWPESELEITVRTYAEDPKVTFVGTYGFSAALSTWMVFDNQTGAILDGGVAGDWGAVPSEENGWSSLTYDPYLLVRTLEYDPATGTGTVRWSDECEVPEQGVGLPCLLLGSTGCVLLLRGRIRN